MKGGPDLKNTVMKDSITTGTHALTSDDSLKQEA